VHGKAGVKIRNLRIASLGNAASKQELKLACQMWSVKDLWFGKADKIAAFAEIFPKIKELGYAGVQCGAFIRLDQDKLEKVLKDNGLVIVDQPVNMTDLDNEENLNKTIAFCKRFGVDFVYIPWYSSKTVAGWKDFCGKLNAVEAKLAKNGIKVGYHHHIDELTKKVEGVYPWDILTSAEGVRHELDIGPILESARVPAEEIKRLRGRLPGGIHAKPVGATAAGAPGEKHDWPRIVAAAGKAGVKWLVVECEKRQNTFEDVAASAKYLRPLLTVANEMK
jgi:sugar phosphate isomerase/epimerase